VHQHIWSEPFLEALRRRRRPPRMEGWTLRLAGEPDYRVNPRDHDVDARARQARADGLESVLVSPSSPLGVEWLPPGEAIPLLDAYHRGARALPRPFRAWASACLTEIDADRLATELDGGCVGLQLPATALLDNGGYRRCAPLLSLLEARELPLFIHPGSLPPAPRTLELPAWWPALVSYVQQMHAAWYAFAAFGRARHPRLRVCFGMLAVLAPLHAERAQARGGGRRAVDFDAFLDTSSYGPDAVDATVREVGIDVLVNGSDRPYAAPGRDWPGEAAAHAIRVSNPGRLLVMRGAVSPA
jgi:hypothetical protein